MSARLTVVAIALALSACAGGSLRSAREFASWDDGPQAAIPLFALAVQAPGDRRVFVAGDNPHGRLGLPPTDQWVEGLLELPEPAVSIVHSASGFVFLTRTGRVYATGRARPGPSWALGPVDLPGRVSHIVEVSGLGFCALVRGDGVYCWARDAGEPSRPPVRLPHSPREAVTLSGGPGVLCALARGGTLRCWDAAAAARGQPPGFVARDVRALAENEARCFVQGPRRVLRCWWPRLREFGVANVQSVSASGGATVCAIGTRAGDQQPWLFCSGMSDTRTGWINVGPHGVDPATVPETEGMVILERLRPVLPVSRRAVVRVFDFLVCVREPDTGIRCDPAVEHTPLSALAEIGRLPISTRPYDPSIHREFAP